MVAATNARKEIEKALPSILEAVIGQAKNGDIQAAKILIDKLCPNLRPVALPINLPMPTNGVLSEMGEEILNATMTGGISPDIGSMLITALANQAKIIEISDLTKRIEALENQPPEQKL